MSDLRAEEGAGRGVPHDEGQSERVCVVELDFAAWNVDY